MNELMGDFSTYIYKIKAFRKYIPALAVIVAALLYFLNLRGTPYLSIPGQQLVFESAPFEHFTISFLNRCRVVSYEVTPIPTSDSSGTKPTIVDREALELIVDNSFYLKGASNANSRYQVSVYMGPTVSIDIEAVLIDGKPIELKTFLSQCLNSEAELIRHRYIRKDLAEYIFRLNDPVSNLILTPMTFGIIWLIMYSLVPMEARAYLYSDERFIKYLKKTLAIESLTGTTEKAFDKYTEQWDRRDRHLRFLQALGPALGFILTVSSLVQALHPAVQTTNDLDQFLKGIHVAMISTFLGLLLRLVALESSRVNDALLIRADAQLTARLSSSAPGDSRPTTGGAVT